MDETFGEDPYLASELGAAMVKGYQGEDNAADTSVMACAKHYIGYGEATGARDSYDTSITYRKVKDTFLPPFEKTVCPPSRCMISGLDCRIRRLRIRI